MNAVEITALCRFVRAACPSQPWDEHTAEAWEIIIPPDYALEECQAAVVTIVRRGERFIDPGIIIAEVRRVRADAADREHTRIVLDPDAYRAEVEAADAAFLAKLAARAGRAPLALIKPVPPADYEDGGR